jgi:7,8-dihydropterin-6-yl-methyl-4-(beta-D-ribofuranosyl)aminobenzene 5'-phosphate synthase
MLQEVNNINITILVDNITDRLLPSLSLVKRPILISNKRFNKPPIAEHGFSTLVEISYQYKDKKILKKFLFDTGVSKNGIIYNSNIFGIDFEDIETIILSHGHFDHISGLISVLKKSIDLLKLLHIQMHFLDDGLYFLMAEKQEWTY